MTDRLSKRRHRFFAPLVILFFIPVLLFAQVTWTQRPNVFSGSFYPEICWAGDKLIVVAGGGTIYTSSDATQWTSRTSGTSKKLNRVAWTGTQTIAVGDSGIILTSPTGIDWTIQNSGTKRNLHCVLQAGNQLVAVGDSGTILTSPDGTVWASQTSNTVQTIYGCAWTGTQIVVVGDGTILTSPNGVDWTSHDSIFAVHNSDYRKDVFSLWDVVWTGTRLVAVGSNSAHVTSQNGIDWTRQPVGAGDSVTTEAIIWSGKIVVGVDNPGIISSPDGIWWTTQNMRSPYTMNSVAWTGTLFIALSISGEVYVSPFDSSAAPVRNETRCRRDHSFTLSNDASSLDAYFPSSMMDVPGCFSIYTLEGKLIMRQTITLTSAHHEWDISHIPEGAYFFSVYQNNTNNIKIFERLR